MIFKLKFFFILTSNLHKLFIFVILFLFLSLEKKENYKQTNKMKITTVKIILQLYFQLSPTALSILCFGIHLKSLSTANILLLVSIQLGYAMVKMIAGICRMKRTVKKVNILWFMIGLKNKIK